jgi:PAS domain S-box-containing protein
MKNGSNERNNKVLIVDDNPSIHADFRKTLGGTSAKAAELAQATAQLFGGSISISPRARFDLTTVEQGEQALSAVEAAVQSGTPFAMAFVDVRMPPGWDGIETISRIWKVDPDIQIVLCTAYSDYSWDEIGSRLNGTDRLVILKKPFDPLEVLQLASALTEKWALHQRAKNDFQDLERKVAGRTQELQRANRELQREIKDHQQTERALLAMQEKLNHFLARSPAVLYSFKFDGDEPVPAWVSENFAHLIGGEVQDWYQQASRLEYVEEGDRAAVRAGLKTLFERGFLTSEYRVRRKDGQSRWVRDDRKLLCGGDGQPLEIIGCWTDITEQKLLQEELRQAQKMESVGQLAGGVAHDFNNLLMVIQGYIELLLNTEEFPAPVTESLRQVFGAAEKAGHLTRQLLAFSRKQMMQLQELDLNELIGTVTKLLSRTLGEHIKVHALCAPRIPCIFADRSMVDQVIMNLAVNARDAMPQGGELTFSTGVHEITESYKRQQPDSRPGSFVSLSVTDTGTGIAKEHLPHLFEPFFTTKEVGKGTGLGLATVYGIVKQHEGWIEVDSQPGRGTTFRIFVPVASAANGPGYQTDIIPAVRGGKETILLVEDEPAVRGLVRTSLQRYGYQVHTAASGVEALKQWAEHLNEIDLLVTDVVMPDGVSGWELAKQMQARKATLKVVYMSGYNSNMTVMESGPVIENGNMFLQKPFKPQRLAEVVRACLENAPQRFGASTPPGIKQAGKD